MAKRFFSVRVEPPENFAGSRTGVPKCRTQELGKRKSGAALRTACFDPKDREWRTQRVLLPKSRFKKCGRSLCAKDERAEKLLETIESQHGAVRKKKTGGPDDFTVH